MGNSCNRHTPRHYVYTSAPNVLGDVEDSESSCVSSSCVDPMLDVAKKCGLLSTIYLYDSHA